MNQNPEYLFVGFSIGVYSMAAMVIILTFLYFSKPRVQEPKMSEVTETRLTKVSLVKEWPARFLKFLKTTRGSPVQAKADIRAKQVLERPASDSSTLPESTTKAIEAKEKARQKEKSSIETTPSQKTDAVLEKPETQHIPAVKQDLPQTTAGTLPVQDKTVIAKPGVADKTSNGEQATPSVTSSGAVSGAVFTTTSPTAYVEPAKEKAAPATSTGRSHEAVPITVAQQKHPSGEHGRKEPVVAAKGETPNLTGVAPDATVNNDRRNIEMQEKPKQEKPTEDFSELFTEDNSEDDNVSILAKELEEVDSQDILQNTQNLVNKIKKNGQ